MDPAVASLLVLAGTVALFIWNRLPVGSVAVLTALTLYATGLVDAETAIGGFGDPVVVFIATLFVVSAGLDASGLTTSAGRALVEQVGEGRARLLGAVMVLCALLSALVTPNGAWPRCSRSWSSWRRGSRPRRPSCSCRWRSPRTQAACSR